MKQHNNFKTYLDKYAELIGLALEDKLSLWIKEFDHIAPRLHPLFFLLQEGSHGGKRIRGSLVFLGYQYALGRELSSEEEKIILQMALAYEIFQTAILAHDDVIDKSMLRRGMPTIYQQLGGDHYGVSQTISIGDLGFVLTYKMMSESDFSSDAKLKAMTFFSDSIAKTILGQMLDVELSYKNLSINETLLQEIKQVYTLKTAYYTFVAPLTLGALLGNADHQVLEKIKLFGEHIGVAFQVNDDIADIFENGQSSSKDRGDDIKEGKITLLYAKAMQNATPAQHRILSTYYGKPLIAEKSVAEIKNVFVQTGALSYVRSIAIDAEKKAREIGRMLSRDTTKENPFEDIVDYLTGKEEK